VEIHLKNLKLLMVAVMMPLLVSCSSGADKLVKVDLGPIPYSIEVPGEIADQLFVENMVTSTPNEYTRQAIEAGAVSQVYLMYRADDGSVHGFAGVYYFTKVDFDKAQNPEEPPVYGSSVVEEGSMVLAVQGPQDSIFEPESQDGKNVSALYTIVYDPKSYKLS